MQAIKTQIELVAYDLGMQIITRHGLQTQVDALSEENAELRRRLEEVAQRGAPTVSEEKSAAMPPQE